LSIVLVNPPHSFLETHSGREGKRKSNDIFSYPPLGILYIASVLEKDGIKVRVIDAPALKIGVREIVHEIEKEKPVVVGISATTPQTYTAVQLAKMLKAEYNNNLIIGIGGAHVSADTGFINRFPYFDFALTGEGEVTLPKILRKILDGERVRGIYHGEAPSNLDEIPFPARELVDNDLYFMPIHEKKFTSIIASRGCPYNCLYCSRPVIGQNVRFRSPKNVVNEIKQCTDKFGVEWFQFVDDTMTLNRDRIIRLSEEIVNQKLEVEWGCQTRVDLVDEKLLRAMFKAGCREISFGIESGSERVRTVLRKNFTNKSVFNAFDCCRKIGMETTAFFILGLPTETKDELHQTIKFSKMIKANYIEVHVATPLPGSDLFTIAAKEGIIPIDVWDKHAKGELEDFPLYVSPLLTGEDLHREQKRAYVTFYFRPHYIFRRLFSDAHSVKKLQRDLKTAISLMKW
jgi:anaerobic magnesium-protoporphyrin IX monomethyl ester cyclase